MSPIFVSKLYDVSVVVVVVVVVVTHLCNSQLVYFGELDVKIDHDYVFISKIRSDFLLLEIPRVIKIRGDETHKMPGSSQTKKEKKVKRCVYLPSNSPGAKKNRSS